jgi:hypothetical protein
MGELQPRRLPLRDVPSPRSGTIATGNLMPYDPRAHGAQCDRTCSVCGKALVRKSYEKPYQFKARRTCGKSCAIHLHNPGQWRYWAQLSLEERFWCRVKQTRGSGCWLWTGARTGPPDQKTYGTIRVRGRQTKAHILSWQLAFGVIPAGMLVCHKCDNPPCVRPDHLFLGTSVDNTTDAFDKGRRRRCVLSAAQIIQARSMRAAGHTYRSIGDHFSVSYGAARTAILGHR